MTRVAAVAVLTLLAALAGAGPACGGSAPRDGAGADPAFGLWLTENARAIVRIAPCGRRACGRIVWTAGQGASCGQAILTGLERHAPGRWEGGTVIDPRDGARYSARVSVAGARLTMRGYLGLAIFGRSQVWTRVADDRGGCGAGPDAPGEGVR